MAAPYPADRIAAVLCESALPTVYRVFPERYLQTPLGTAPGDSRFCARADGFSLLYSTSDLATGFVEVIVRDRFMAQAPREIRLKEVTQRAWAQISSLPGTQLNLLDLRQEGCVKMGIPTDAVKARNHAAGRALGRTLYRYHGQVDGILFSSRLTGQDVYAIFDRALDKLSVMDTGWLAEHPELPAILSRFDMRLKTG